MTFDVNKHLIQIKTSQGAREYLPLQGRLLWFTGEVSEYQIETELILLDIDKEVTVERSVWDNEKRRNVPVQKTAKGIAVYHATLAIYKDGTLVKRVPGDKMETAVDFPDYLEKAQSGAIGRCLMFAGYGTAFALELDEGDRLTDSPVERVISPSDVEKVKAEWATAFSIPEGQMEARWPKFKQYALNGMVSDPDLKASHLTKMWEKITMQKREMKSAS